jgi:hypothetical protein
MSAEQARESLVETLDVTSGQIEDKTMTDAPANLRELLDYWEARRQDAIQGRYSPEPNSGDHLGTYIKGLKRCSDDLERVIHRGPKPDPLPRFIVTTDSLKMVREALCVAQHGLGYLHDRNADRHRELLGRLIESIDQQRPLGPDGKHDHRHTPTCGCEDKA